MRLRRRALRCLRRAAVAAAWAALAAAGAGAQPGDVFPGIPEVRSAGGTARVVLHAILDPATGAPAFAYDTLAGVVPTIRVRPGDVIALTVDNDLPRAPGMRNDVNVHFHGLTVSPRMPGDDALGSVAHPGESIVYRVRVPRDHEPGLYWYHPHVHGTSYRDVTAGMSGALVVEGLERHFPALAAMRERIVVLRDVATGPAALADADMPMNTASAMPTHAARRTSHAGDACGPESGLQPTLNRQPRAHIGIAPGESQFVRVVNASAARFFDLSVDGSRLEVLALDGFARDAYPGTAPARLSDHVLVPPGGRAEFVVRAPARPTVLRSACVDAGRGSDPNPPAILAELADPRAGGAAADLAASRPDEPRTTVPPPLRTAAPLPANTYARALPPPAAVRHVRLTEDARGFYIDGRAYAPGAAPAFVARSGTVERWTVENATAEIHDFHIHQVHFVPLEVDGRPAGERVWRDTIDVPPQRRTAHGFVPGSVTLAVDLRDPVVRGTFFFHCHLLDHEDGGMMATVRVR